jgi:hypothetical protein
MEAIVSKLKSVAEKVELTSAPRSSKGNKDVLVTANSLGEGSIVEIGNLAGHLKLLLGLDTGLLSNEVGQAVQVTARLVLLGLCTLSIEELESRETLNLKSLAELTLGVGVDLCNLNLVLGVLVGVCKVLPDGSKLLAVTAPRSEEFDEGGLAGLENDVVKVGGEQFDDGGFSCDGGGEGAEHEALDENHVG